MSKKPSLKDVDLMLAEYARQQPQPGRPPERVDHPPHYGGGDNPYEAIKVIEAWGLGFCLGNTIKYISRAGEKGDAHTDLKKALWYLQRAVTRLEVEAVNDAKSL